MPKPFVQLTIGEFETLVRDFQFKREIDSIHMHHTWKPRQSDYKGRSTIDGMWEYHSETNNWSDIAQHITIAPDGSIWTGRSWNQSPASSTGYNGTSKKGPFMFEMIGDFDTGKEKLGGSQRESVIRVILSLMEKFGLDISQLRFHHQLGSSKSCPGSAIDYAKFCDEVVATRDSQERSPGTRSRSVGSSPVPAKKLIRKRLTQTILPSTRLASAHCLGSSSTMR